jgi:hypothetical protein
LATAVGDGGCSTLFAFSLFTRRMCGGQPFYPEHVEGQLSFLSPFVFSPFRLLPAVFFTRRFCGGVAGHPSEFHYSFSFSRVIYIFMSPIFLLTDEKSQYFMDITEFSIHAVKP